MWTLSQGWYGDRLAAAYQPRTAPELQSVLDDAGLDDAFWTL
jgi:hypothetical protein